MNNLLLTCLSLFVSTTLYAQSSIGLKVGANVSEVKNLAASPQQRYAFNAGAIVRQSITKRFFLQQELLYSSKGYRFEPPFASNEGANRLQYLAVPILFGFYANENFSLLLGPELNYLMKSAVRYDKNVIDFTKQYPRFDAGIDVGLACRINKKFRAELRYNHGFNTLYYTDFAGVKHDQVKGVTECFKQEFIVGLNNQL